MADDPIDMDRTLAVKESQHTREQSLLFSQATPVQVKRQMQWKLLIKKVGDGLINLGSRVKEWVAAPQSSSYVPQLRLDK